MDYSKWLTREEIDVLKAKGVDLELSITNLEDFNRGAAGNTPPVIPEGVPDIDGDTVLDLRGSTAFSITAEERENFAQKFPHAAGYLVSPPGTDVSRVELEQAGTALLPYFSYGFLNGGSATSYGDRKKNKGFNEDLFALYEKEFTRLADASRGKPKGVTPGFLQPDGDAGPSYMELKLRSLLMLMKKYTALTGKEAHNIPFFQMTSVGNNNEVQDALSSYRDSPWLKPLAASMGLSPWEGFSAVQPLVTAYTHSSKGDKKDIFRPFITIPGGHGQCFRVLKETWQNLYDRGIRFISLGNIDNIGYTLDPVELALLALKGAAAGFDESYKTAVDIKGGILVIDDADRMNCVDLGVGISFEEAAALEASGKKILFNCGSGLFSLEWLLDNIDRIIQDLPLRFSDQNKDAGLYSQAEQVTWEVIGMINKPLIFAVDKYDRFLAAKILLENMMTSGCKLDDPAFPADRAKGGIRHTAENLHRGLKDILIRKYGLKLQNNRWIPVESEGQ
ncbi:MAG: UTP--glucose-1-phosphate uridylyltransferase [Spirochaetales bacterium]|nr:UTP--glucose-1-phosphate uridylyltransferase [Spirochaetales bacterium]